MNALCRDCPDHEACMTGWPCQAVKDADASHRALRATDVAIAAVSALREIAGLHNEVEVGEGETSCAICLDDNFPCATRRMIAVAFGVVA